MSRGVNKVILIGNVGTDPEFRVTSSGTKVGSLSLATSRQYSEAGVKKEKTDWHRVKCFGQTAQAVEDFVAKGDRLYIEGRIEYSMTEDDNGKRYWTDIVAWDVQFLTPKKRDQSPAPVEQPDDDMPF